MQQHKVRSSVVPTSGPRLFRQAGCGCIYIDLGNRETLTVEYCGRENHDPQYWFGQRDWILPANLSEEFLSASQHEHIFDEINRLMMLGRQFEKVKSLLGIEVKV